MPSLPVTMEVPSGSLLLALAHSPEYINLCLSFSTSLFSAITSLSSATVLLGSISIDSLSSDGPLTVLPGVS